MATLNPALKDFWRTKARYKVLYGGRASSKTWDTAGIAIFLASQYSLRFLCVRQFQNRIEDSVYSVLKTQIRRFNLQDEFLILRNKIIHKYTGSEFLFYGLARNIEEIKSLEGVDICWIEEAQTLTKEQWDILMPTIRKENSEIWIIFNPRYETDFVYQRFVLNPPENAIVRKINYDENPFLSKTMLNEIENLKKTDYDEYRHIYLGEPKSEFEDSIIKKKWLEAIIDAHKKLNIEVSGEKIIGYDIADSGEDKCAIAIRQGCLLYHIQEWKALEDELIKSHSKVYEIARKENARIIYDCIGVGASAGATFKQLGWKRFTKFNAGEKVLKPNSNYGNTGIKNKDMFANLKAQVWWNIADRIKKTYNAIKNNESIKEDEVISISSNIDKKLLDKLFTELSQPRRDYDNYGRVKVESKEDLKKRGIPSPNLADAFIMAFSNVGRNTLIDSL